MTIPLPVGPLTPYVTPELLVSASTGISWSTIPPRGSPAQQYAEQLNMCMRASGDADSYCNQILRASSAIESVSGPNFQMTIQSDTGNVRVILQRWPILDITQIQVSPNSFPRSWVTLPAGMFDIERPVIGLYGTNSPGGDAQGGQAIIFAPGFVSWWRGRWGYEARISYISGWPHTSLTTAATAGSTTIQVDDCTGWAPFSTTSIASPSATAGATGVVYDSGFQEVIQVTTASVTSGPGTLTLKTALQFAHAAGVMVSAMPGSVIEAVIYLCVAQALTRGATSTTVHAIPGGSGGKENDPQVMVERAHKLLAPFRRVK